MFNNKPGSIWAACVQRPIRYRKPARSPARLWDRPRYPGSMTTIHYKPSILVEPEVLQVEVQPIEKHVKEATVVVNPHLSASAYGPTAVADLKQKLSDMGVDKPISVNGGPVRTGLKKCHCVQCGKPTKKAPQAQYCEPCRKKQAVKAVQKNRSAKKIQQN